MISTSSSSAETAADSQVRLIQADGETHEDLACGRRTCDMGDPAPLLPRNQMRNIEDILSGMKLRAFHWRMLGLVGGGYFAVCAEMMLFIFLSEPVSDEWGLGDLEFPWLPFCTGITSIVGGYIAGTCSDKYGRQPPFVIGIICLAVFGVASAFAPNYPAFIALRCAVTLGIGAFEATGFVLLLEFLPKNHRGSIMVVVTLCGALGAVLVAGLAWLILPHFGWRWFVAFCAVPALLLLAVMWPLAHFSESPRFLMVKGRKTETLQVLNRIEKQDYSNLTCPDTLPSSKQGLSPTHLARLFSPELRGQSVTFTLIWFLEATGYWGVTAYLPEYMSSRLGAHAQLSLFSVFIGELPGIVLAMLLVEGNMLGRIRTLRFFSALTAASLLLFAAVPQHSVQAALIILCYFSMVPIYSILNTYTPEAFPTDMRSTALAWMNIVIEFPGLLTPFIGATLLSSSLPWLYPLVWAVVFLFQFALTFNLKVETAGQSLQDVQHERVQECSSIKQSTESIKIKPEPC
ncbi:synaptic vesicle 2-related protein [Plakobranchus ocellatus]|uniref:Synaptic vesicle 2-related protein n=1 Tax=Plakobranchus ocellatus TaxID=259542 RepID=A0AAV4C6E4_9GAST|nr:synaptic vesicle 2-related protein [Plakobranchus ocellatus]